MSTNIRVKKICIYCNQPFIAKTTITKFCSHNCNNRYYKEKKKEQKVTSTILQTNGILANRARRQANEKNYSEQMMNRLNGDWFCLKDLAHYLGIGERTIFRLIKDPTFPKVKIGRRLVFYKHQVVEYFNKKNGGV